MVTRNWYMYMKSTRARKVIDNGFRLPSGGYAKAGYNVSSSASVLTAMTLRADSVVYTTNTTGIVLGSGTTPATVDDYKLESIITSGLSASVANTVDEDDNHRQMLSITNISDEAITIGEVGIIGSVYVGAASSSTQYVLLDRTVLDEPLTIPAGGIGLLTYTIRLEIPEA